MVQALERVIKVAMSIPNEGHTLPEAYDNHLIHAQRIGAYEMKQMLENKLYKVKKRHKLKDEELKGVKFHKQRYEFYWYTAGRLLTQMAREKLIRYALDARCDFIIMYDDDMTLPGDMAIRLLDQMKKHPEIDVLGCLAFMRNPPHYPVLYSVIDGYDPVRHLPYYINNYVKRYPKNTLIEADAVGFGGVCIRLDFVRKNMKEPYFMSTANTGEDIWFCVKAKEAGGRIFMDTGIKMGHLRNPEIVDEEYFEKWVKDNKHDLGPKFKSKYEKDGEGKER